jgi:hypothetical protein
MAELIAEIQGICLCVARAYNTNDNHYPNDIFALRSRKLPQQHCKIDILSGQKG